MKWGIRRYQPYSVKPRGSGKGGKEIGEARSYGKASGGPKFGKIFSSKDKESTKLSKSINSYLDKSSAMAEFKSKTESVRKQLAVMESQIDKVPRRITAENQDPVSDAGLRALYKMQGYYDIGRADSYEEEDPDTKASIQEWFVIEDQTVGLWAISDLVKKGKTAKDIHNMIEEYDEKERYLNNELEKVKEDTVEHIKSDPNFNHLSSSEIRQAVTSEIWDRDPANLNNYPSLWDLSDANNSGVDIDKYVSCLEEAYGRTSSKDTKKSVDQEALSKKLNSLADKALRDPSAEKAMEEAIREAMDAGYTIGINNSGKGDTYKLIKVPEEDRPATDLGSKSQYGGLFNKNQLPEQKASLEALGAIVGSTFQTMSYKNYNKLTDKLASYISDSDAKKYSDAMSVLNSSKDSTEIAKAQKTIQECVNKYTPETKDTLDVYTESKFINPKRSKMPASDITKEAYKKAIESRAAYKEKYGSKSSTSATKQQRSRVRALKSSGYSYAEIAKRLGISEGAVSYYLNS